MGFIIIFYLVALFILNTFVSMTRLLWFFLFSTMSLLSSAQNEIRPFASHNQSPLIHFFGLPNNEGGTIMAKNKYYLSTRYNLTSNTTNALTPDEFVYFDGEMTRIDLALRYGITNNFEIGLSLPFVRHSSGIMDSSVDEFHQLLGLSGGARALVPNDQIRYMYAQNESSYFNLSEDSFGFGDISFEVGFKLLQGKQHAMALRAYLKFNNGDKEQLIGSGTVDLSYQLSGSLVGTGKKPVSFFYSLGYLRVGRGSVLENMQVKNVTFGSLGLAVFAKSWLVPKIQFDYHSRFYRNSNTQELGQFGMQFLMGADFILNDHATLTAGFTEDIKINTSPDIVLHLGFGYAF